MQPPATAPTTLRAPPSTRLSLRRYGIDALLSTSPDSALACSSDIVAQYLAIGPESAAQFAALPRATQVTPSSSTLSSPS